MVPVVPDSLTLGDASVIQSMFKLCIDQCFLIIGRESKSAIKLGSPPLLVARPPTMMTSNELPPQRHLTGLKVHQGPSLGRPLTPETPVPQPYLVKVSLPIRWGTVRRRFPRLLTKEQKVWSLHCLSTTGLILTPNALGSLQKRMGQDLGANHKIRLAWEALPYLGWTVPVAQRRSAWRRWFMLTTPPSWMFSWYLLPLSGAGYSHIRDPTISPPPPPS